MSKTPNSPPGAPGTPSAKPRICKKLVIKGHATSTGASYTLFLKVQLPSTEREESYLLLNDPTVELQDVIVHRLDASGAAPALSTSAATAASSLGIPLSIDHQLNDSLIDFEPESTARAKSSAQSSDQSNLPKIVRRNDGTIVIQTTSKSSPRSKQSSTSSHANSLYMVTLQLLAHPFSKPPLSPFSVRLAVPFCLNNFMRFTVDESIDQDLGSRGLAVEVDPPILPISGQLKSPRRRPWSSASSRRTLNVASLSDEEDVTLLGAASVDDSDLEQDESAIVGPFHACDALVLRIAAPQAGDWVSSAPHFSTLSNALRAKHVVSSITYLRRTDQVSGQTQTELSDAEAFDFEATVQLQEPFFPGLDREVFLYMQLDHSTLVTAWQPTAVDASRGILSWSFGSVGSSSSSPNQLPRTTADGALSKSPTFDIGDLVVLPDPAQQAVDEEDLLKVAPPKGINDNDFDFSLDNAAATPTKQRRFSLQSATSAKPYPSQPPSEQSEPAGGSSNMLVIAFNLLPVLQSNEPIAITVRGMVTLSSEWHGSLQRSELDKLPGGLSVSTALTQEYAEASIGAQSVHTPQPQSTHHPMESLEDSRETVQQQEYKNGLSMQSLHPVHNTPTEELLRQALAIIEAHNASLSEPNRTALVKQDALPQSRREEGQVKTKDWFLRMSHLLWTLLLTALVLMLFNAGQTANRDLVAKLDELSRMVEASARSNAQPFPVVAENAIPALSVADVAIPAASRAFSADCSDCDRRGEQDPDQLTDDRRQVYHKEDTSNSQDSESEVVWQDESKQVQPNGEEMGVTCFISNWLRDLLRSPVMILQRIFDMLTGA